MQPFLVGIAGGSGSGKSTFCRAVADRLTDDVQVIQHDSYYVDHGHLTIEESRRLNFDHPDSLESQLLLEHLVALQNGRSIEVPCYDFSTHSRTTRTQVVQPAAVILVEGILLFADAAIADVLDLRIFVDAADAVRLQRRIDRDQKHRGRTAESVVQQWESSVQPMFNQFVAETENRAHITVRMDRPNPQAVETISRSLRTRVPPTA